MPVSVTYLVRDRRTIQLPVGDEVLTLTYRPSGYTPETEDRLREGVESQRGGAAVVALLADCLVEWDLLDEKGKPLPTDVEVLRRLPLTFLVQLVQAIATDMAPNPLSAGGSGAGSLPTVD